MVNSFILFLCFPKRQIETSTGQLAASALTCVQIPTPERSLIIIFFFSDGVIGHATQGSRAEKKDFTEIPQCFL
jgi:hypothetical protein